MNVRINRLTAAATAVAAGILISGFAAVAPASANTVDMTPGNKVSPAVPACGEWSHPVLVSPTQWGCSPAQTGPGRHANH